ncbi:MAG: ABC transporter ATP-binding protein [Candidatus Shapirobacteria bacterium]|nr:ABC transporter ATP-binding protein [Candidatus Shapirobacteria bacterium]MDD4410137.1 ABC transporter ATP-binding protein [Candidatus Shapirobacteria bacterium]
MNYSLKIYDDKNKEKLSFFSLGKQFLIFLKGERLKLVLSFISIIVNSAVGIATPFLLGIAIDKFIQNKDLVVLTNYSLIILAIYAIGFVTNFIQTRTMGHIGQNILFKLRQALFLKIQSLPLAFFNQNKLGDLISRINNDTDKLNQFFSQQLNQFAGNFFTMLGIGIFIFFINWKLALITLVSAFILFIITYFITPWIGKRNRLSLQSLGNLSAEIQESLNNFKVMVAFDRRDYFRDNFNHVNSDNFKYSVNSGIANNISGPFYDFAGNMATLLVLVYGIFLITQGQFTVGILISFLSYTDRFYGPLRQMASILSSAQIALAGWNRIFEILNLSSDMPILPKTAIKETDSIMHFENVSFKYEDSDWILKNVNFNFCYGKTYAIVGPTGGGKSTLASLMTRLYDPQEGEVFLEGQNIKTFESEDLSKKIGFILQEQYLFTGTVGENITYGNPNFPVYSKTKLVKILKDLKLEVLVNKFDQGLDTPITPTTETISLGQKQLISFIRAIIREPDILIMDEATANIDTITEGLLQKIIDKLPLKTTKVIIAHRLNTIKKADEIYFVNNGSIETTESFEKSLDLITKSKRNS